MSTDDTPLGWLFLALGFLLILSAFFSGTETAMMSLNRYRLRHSAREGSRAARLAERLLARPERLIGVILLGNNLVNIAASAIVTIIADQLGGNLGVAIGIGVFTLIVLIFSELTPKTLGVRYPERVALPAAFIYYPLLKICYPIVWAVNGIANGLLWLLGERREANDALEALSREELRTVLAEAGGMIPKRHQQMLLSILDLERVGVDDIMVPRHDIAGIDLDDDWPSIRAQLNNAHYTRLPVYEEDLQRIVGMLHMRKVMRQLSRGELDKATLRELVDEPYFVPEGTSLHRQLINFQTTHERVGLVVDEYGDILGLVTLQDLLEEIVGEFTTDPASIRTHVQPQRDGSYVVDCSINVRALNRTMRWKLPTDGAKTLNGLILEFLETIPEPGTSLKLAGYVIEIAKTSGNAVKTVRMRTPAPPSGRERANATPLTG